MMKKLLSTTTLTLLFICQIFYQNIAIAENLNSKNVNPETKVPKVIILLGAPGSGKGTQAVKLSKELKIPHISTGDIFRDNVKNNTELGKKVKSYMDAGKLVPDELVTELLQDRLSQKDAEKGYILDGYPRTLKQAEDFEKFAGKKLNIIAIYLDVSDAVLLERINKRAKESKVVRSDDKPEIAKDRIKVYHKQTAPLIDYYKKKGQLTTLKGEEGIEKNYDEILKIYRQ